MSLPLKFSLVDIHHLIGARETRVQYLPSPNKKEKEKGEREKATPIQYQTQPNYFTVDLQFMTFLR